MEQKIYINLPVADLEASKGFYAKLGYQFNPLYTNEVAACMVVSDSIHVMLLTKPFFATFTAKDIVDAKTSAQVLICLSKESRDAVDVMVDSAIAAGAKIERPTNDHDFCTSEVLTTSTGIYGRLCGWMKPPINKRSARSK